MAPQLIISNGILAGKQTSDGEYIFPYNPFPNYPFSPLPHEYAYPCYVMAIVWSCPHDTYLQNTFYNYVIREGLLVFYKFIFPNPNFPYELFPLYKHNYNINNDLSIYFFFLHGI